MSNNTTLPRKVDVDWPFDCTIFDFVRPVNRTVTLPIGESLRSLNVILPCRVSPGLYVARCPWMSMHSSELLGVVIPLIFVNDKL